MNTSLSQAEMPKTVLYKAMFESSLHSNIELEYDHSVQYLQAIGGYNDFNFDNIKKMLEKFDEIIPREFYYEGNPNNGKRVYKISVGRECSPVIYISLVAFTGLGNTSRAIAEIISRKEQFEAIAKEVGKADEFSIEHTSEPAGRGWKDRESLQIRMWWD